MKVESEGERVIRLQRNHSNDEAEQLPRSWRGLTSLLAALAALITMIGLAAPASAATTVSGYVTCVSQRSVVGVWVQAVNGGSGWASWSPQPENYSARYQYSLPYGGQYAIHVGCGGTPARWATANYSDNVGGTNNSFTCYDVPNAGYAYLRCQHT